MKNSGILYIISGPSGVGKGTICRQLVEKNDNLSFSVSATTRKPRNEDIEGATYFFKTEDEFKEMIDENMFLEWAIYNGNYYGTPVAPVEQKLTEGKDIILEIDVQGALNVIEREIGGVSIFIAPPDENALYERLKGRGTESEEEIQKRISAAEYELKLKDKYDYIVINDKLEDAISRVEEIMSFEKQKRVN